MQRFKKIGKGGPDSPRLSLGGNAAAAAAATPYDIAPASTAEDADETTPKIVRRKSAADKGILMKGAGKVRNEFDLVVEEVDEF